MYPTNIYQSGILAAFGELHKCSTCLHGAYIINRFVNKLHILEYVMHMEGGIIIITVISAVVMPEGEKQNNADVVPDSQSHWWREQLELMTWKLF